MSYSWGQLGLTACWLLVVGSVDGQDHMILVPTGIQMIRIIHPQGYLVDGYPGPRIDRHVDGHHKRVTRVQG